MNTVQLVEKRYEIGFPIFQKLFELKKDDFIKVMKHIFRNKEFMIQVLDNNPKVMKTLFNDEAEQISIHFYDSIEINFLGVFYKPEHGSKNIVLEFNEFFNLDSALNKL